MKNNLLNDLWLKMSKDGKTKIFLLQYIILKEPKILEIKNS